MGFKRMGPCYEDGLHQLKVHGESDWPALHGVNSLQDAYLFDPPSCLGCSPTMSVCDIVYFCAAVWLGSAASVLIVWDIWWR